ncbi:MAG: PilZ domain-containing protein [Desulfobacterales bacterium]|nr:PilZ domain-containing protein [Desulfobacterales bacterium]
MAKKTYVTDDNKATFVCDVCQHARIADVSRYKNIGKALTVKCKCKCGHQFKVTLEKRGILRKSVNFAGTYTHISPLGDRIEGHITVRNLSRKGLQLELNSNHGFQVGDSLDVDFRLDDVSHSPVLKTVIVRNINGRKIGTEFSEAEAFDKMLGLYLMK